MPTVLVAEDDLAIRDLLTFLLDTSGHQVLACADGGSALATARRERPDLAILDVSMPGINGIEVCRALRGTADTELMPVLMLTSHGQWLDVSSGFDAGADDYLVKPFEPSELMARIETLLEQSGTDRPASAS
ncbi:response regulator transcription factor [Dactylosporangium sp. NPDC000555]|uniref:response regulator transcription factor n=1 Tax=Dactylosporangium sp. NPDC000555 TaxID=3154260 RepID=UPI00331C0DF5